MTYNNNSVRNRINNGMNMKVVTIVIQVGILLELLLSCTSQPNLRVETFEMDFVNSSQFEVKGQLLKKEIPGLQSIIVYDSILIALTTNPNAQLQVFSTNTMEEIGSFCKKGRASNEFFNVFSVTNQIYERSGHIILPLIDNMNDVKEVDITESLRNKKTIIGKKDVCLGAGLGYSFYLDNTIGDSRFELLNNRFDGVEVTDVPCKYIIKGPGKRENELKIFNRLVEVDDKSEIVCPFESTVIKHPTKNLFVNAFGCMDYLIFFDIENDRIFAIHQEGAPTFDDKFQNKCSDLFFNGGCATEKFIFLTYCHSKKTLADEKNGKKVQDILIFNWNGSFVKGIKLDKRLRSIGFDEKKGRLYGMTPKEELYEYDLSTLLP